MTGRLYSTGRAEQAVASLMNQLAAHRRASMIGGRRSGRLGGGVREATLGPRFFIPLMVSVAEEFARELLAERAEASPRSWFKIEKAWAERDVAFQEYEGFPALIGFADARNAILHGLGELTSLQLRQEGQIRARLGAAGITLVGNRLALIDQDVEACADRSRDFVNWLDREAAGDVARPRAL